MYRNSAFSIFLGASALSTGLFFNSPVLGQVLLDCGELIDGEIQAGCELGNAGDVVRMPVASNTEPEVRPVTNTDGFSISVNGDAVDSDPTVEDRIRKTDIALSNADIRVTFDGFEPKTRLAVETVGEPRAYATGETITLQSEMNYPAFVARSEFRIVDRRATGGSRLVTIVPVDPNGRASFVVPSGRDIVVVHRVYDAGGRFDETRPLPLFEADDRGLSSDVEEGADTAAVRNIRVVGGAVTVAATNVAQGARLLTLGETVRPDSEGRLVIQRILPPGDYAVDVAVEGGLQNTRLSRDIEIPRSEWFYHGLADLTFGLEDNEDGSDTTAEGRLQVFADGRTASGWRLTGSIDATQDDLGDLFTRIENKDPRSVLERIDPEDTFPTFGDDSVIEDLTPTSGRVYLRVERDGNFALLGDFQARVSGSSFLRNERTLYGVQGSYAAPTATSNGDPKTKVEVYASSPDQLVGREVFQGTGGSVYFLRQQDITPGTETITIEIRDIDTNRVIDRQSLVRGEDYEVNALLGVVTLTRPLTSTLNENLIQTNRGGDEQVNLVVQYEFTPTGSDVDAMSFGGRAETWVTDNFRVGLTALSDDEGTGVTDQTAQALDFRFEFGANSFAQLDLARSSGSGIATDFSVNGGLTIDEEALATGSGEAFKFEIQGDLQDLGYEGSGVVGAYFEQRNEGFSTLDFQVTAATGDETLYGAFYRRDKTDTSLGYSLYADIYDTDAGLAKTEVGAEVSGNLTQKLSFELGAEYLDETTLTQSGDRIDLAARLEYEASEKLTFAIFGQGTVASDGLDDYNRLGVGLSAQLNDNWSLETEVSGGTGGTGVRLLAAYDREGNSSYFGYELDRGRAIDAGVAQSENGGRFIAGGRNQVNDRVSVFSENTFDIFDAKRTLTSVHGVEYKRSDFLRYDSSIEYGEVNDELERTALSFGVRYDNDALRASGRLEFRKDDAAPTSTVDSFDAVFFDANARYKIDDERRLIMNFSAADTSSDTSSLLGGQVVDASIGYAFRPIRNERLNLLTRIRYLEDTFGQTIDGVAGAGAQQRSTVFSVQASYDLNRQWTLGGSIGGRISETNDGAGWVDNDAFLAVANARFNLVHKWDVLLEARRLDLVDAGSSETSALGTIYRHVGNNAKIGLGYNFGSFSDDLTDIERDDQGLFLNVIAKF
jgi:hypothetical protein